MLIISKRGLEILQTYVPLRKYGISLKTALTCLIKKLKLSPGLQLLLFKRVIRVRPLGHNTQLDLQSDDTIIVDSLLKNTCFYSYKDKSLYFLKNARREKLKDSNYNIVNLLLNDQKYMLCYRQAQ